MDVLIFIAVIVVLILVHELGHFVVAKWSGMRVDEFGIGYPPRALTIAKVRGTEYTLNWIPFGGFVKIYGEDKEAEGSGSFSSKNRLLQALVLIAGVSMNMIFAYILLTAALAAGTPRALTAAEIPHATRVELAIAGVLPGSPAASAGLAAGDIILDAKNSSGTTVNPDPHTFTTIVADSRGAELTLDILRGGEHRSYIVAAKQGFSPSEPSRYALGIEMAPIGVVPLTLGEAALQGASLTWGATKATAVGLVQFFASVFTFSADLSQVAGPVGIAGAVGSAAHSGLGDLLSLAALISINLALINLIPIPALDGGRLLFVIIESITRRPIKPSIAGSINAAGFAFLILLMVVVTAHDIYKIVG